MPDALPPSAPTTNSALVAAYRAATPGSAALAARAVDLLPSGIAHDGRFLDPYPPYMATAAGARKCDVDGRSYVDYFGGHGALLLGHRHPAVMAAVHAQLDRGTHFGACHELEVRWAELVIRMVPSAERVRFTSSGTEATLMALRLARAWTGRQKIVRFIGHFHGWHDHMTSGYMSHYDGSPTTGVVEGVAENILLAHADDSGGFARLLEDHRDVAAVIIEPTGGGGGRMPLDPAFLGVLREQTKAHGVVLIFDEVVTGFRVSPGGAQAHFGVTPDLTTMAKILAGGLPGGAVAGSKAILDLLDFKVTKANGREKIGHPGTFNANPLSAAAGIATLEIVESTDACARANAYGETLRTRLNEMFEEEKISWAAFGSFSKFQLFTNPDHAPITPTSFDAKDHLPALLKGKGASPLHHKLKLGALLNGVDLGSGPGGVISAMHGEEELEITVTAMRETVRALRLEGEV